MCCGSRRNEKGWQRLTHIATATQINNKIRSDAIKEKIKRTITVVNRTCLIWISKAFPAHFEMKAFGSRWSVSSCCRISCYSLRVSSALRRQAKRQVLWHFDMASIEPREPCSRWRRSEKIKRLNVLLGNFYAHRIFVSSRLSGPDCV